MTKPLNNDIEIAVDAHPTDLSPMNTREQALLATYDFLKHMSTLAIVAVGGMLGLAQGVGTRVSPAILASVAIVGLCGFLSLVFMTGVTATQIRQRVHKSSNGFALAMVVIVLMLFACGIGAFIGAFLSQLNNGAA
ncbi:hypothetical protein H8M03_09350 [Sphingomonas sabuli]|uniref:Uncharacterized protein n=1 Tax=Sphingomonas sabuli TaxID=2764186 RepID=A0A7G9L0S4_9SPHN|nr:hypothetical protein [Sphingomonas sabuli]QNM82223.1 hypothetical protein H8M03_09350 [Sphingomonas sabuli]